MYFTKVCNFHKSFDSTLDPVHQCNICCSNSTVVDVHKDNCCIICAYLEEYIMVNFIMSKAKIIFKDFTKMLIVIFQKYDNYVIISPNNSPKINNSRIA